MSILRCDKVIDFDVNSDLNENCIHYLEENYPSVEVELGSSKDG